MIFLEQLVASLSNTSLALLIAVGITLVFGLTGLLNFAHADVIAIGAYIVALVGPHGGWMFVPAISASIVAILVANLVLERLLFRRTLQRTMNGFLISLGLILVIENGLTGIFGVGSYSAKPAIGGVLVGADGRFTYQDIFTIGVTAVVVTALYLFLRLTKLGMAARASAMDRRTAQLMGINTTRIIVIVFGIAGFTGGICGALTVTTYPVTPAIGSNLIFAAFGIALVGGLGSISGATISAVAFGLAETALSAAGYAQWTNVLFFALLIVVLIVRPRGLLRGMVRLVD